MKALASVLVVLTVMISVSAHAKVIAEVVVSGGFMSPDVCGSHQVTIDDTGLVQFQACVAKPQKLAMLSAKVVAKLVKKIDALQISELRRPNQLGCVDAPSTHYSVAQKSGEMKAIAARENCVDLEMTNSNYQVRDVRDLLKGFLALSDF